MCGSVIYSRLRSSFPFGYPFDYDQGYGLFRAGYFAQDEERWGRREEG
jgi:hypothetical protein